MNGLNGTAALVFILLMGGSGSVDAWGYASNVVVQTEPDCHPPVGGFSRDRPLRYHQTAIANPRLAPKEVAV